MDITFLNALLAGLSAWIATYFFFATVVRKPAQVETWAALLRYLLTGWFVGLTVTFSLLALS